MSDWNNHELVRDYKVSAANPEVNWYEYEVNAPALVEMLPDAQGAVLDFGCGPGDITAMLADKFQEVVGCDSSKAMVDVARADYPGINFFQWDGQSSLDTEREYDLVFSKLAIHYVKDLGGLAINLAKIMAERGQLIFSVPHPMRTKDKIRGPYGVQQSYDTEIGTYGIRVTMIHRSIQAYIEAFTKEGFRLTDLREPVIPAEIAKRRELSFEDAAVPKRLNVKFIFEP